VALAISEPPPPDQTAPNPSEGTDAADPATRLEDCISLQEKVISLLEGEWLASREAGRPGQLEETSVELLALLQQTIRHERNIVQDYRALRAEIGSLRIERDELAVALRLTEALSLTDELTGLPNRRGFVQRLDQELSRSQRTGQPLSLVLLDVDNFKDINDCHGHYVGDMILRCYAQSMVREFRQHDLLARYGGEEFIAALPAPDIGHALGLGERLRAAVEAAALPAAQAHVTISIGMAWQAAHDEGDPRSLVERADQALYRAKHAGRNCVHAAPAVEAGEQHADRRA